MNEQLFILDEETTNKNVRSEVEVKWEEKTSKKRRKEGLRDSFIMVICLCCFLIELCLLKHRETACTEK